MFGRSFHELFANKSLEAGVFQETSLIFSAIKLTNNDEYH